MLEVAEAEARTVASSRRPGGIDWRLPACAAAAWSGCLFGTWVATTAHPGLVAVAAGVASGLTTLATVLMGRRVRRRQMDGDGQFPAVAAVVLVVLAVAAVFAVTGSVRGVAANQGPVPAAAALGRPAVLVGVVSSDPRAVNAQFGERHVVEVRARELVTTSHGIRARHRTDARVRLVLSDVPDRFVLGAEVRVRAVPVKGSEGGPGAGKETLWQVREAEVLGDPDVWWRGAATVRASLREVVSERPSDQRALVPSLVVGDDALVSDDLAEAFRTTGLTHLLAVSGTNLTLLLAAALWLGGWCGVRGRARWLVVALCVAGFVLVARAEPSVVRAAVMGVVGHAALERNGAGRGLRCLALACLVVLVWDPWMSRSVGFALSVSATAGILVLVPRWSAALQRWMPRAVAVAIAVPAAAQLACTPIVAWLQGEVSLVAVLANLAAGPAVAPATVLGLLGALVGLVSTPCGAWVAWPAAWAVGWIALVARWCSDLAFPAVSWGTGPVALALLTVLCVLAVPVVPRLLERRGLTLAVVGAVSALVWWGVPQRGWPPPGWLVVACDVGQGDAVVLRAGASAAVVVDAGPEPAPVRRCLDRLGITQVPLVVVTHFHDDHYGGLRGVFDGRRVGVVEVSSAGSETEGAREVAELARSHGARWAVADQGAQSRVGDVVVERVWPPAANAMVSPPAKGGAGEGQDGLNDSSVVLKARVHGLTVLLTGDIEPDAQRALVRSGVALDADVLKVPHHGSRHQHEPFLDAVGAGVALIGVGRDNSYGHPAPDLVTALEGRGVRVLRTDTGGDLAVVRSGRGWGTTSSGVAGGR